MSPFFLFVTELKFDAYKQKRSMEAELNELHHSIGGKTTIYELLIVTIKIADRSIEMFCQCRRLGLISHLETGKFIIAPATKITWIGQIFIILPLRADR